MGYTSAVVRKRLENLIPFESVEEVGIYDVGYPRPRMLYAGEIDGLDTFVVRHESGDRRKILCYSSPRSDIDVVPWEDPLGVVVLKNLQFKVMGGSWLSRFGKKYKRIDEALRKVA
jgi:hypothetical protein